MLALAPQLQSSATLPILKPIEANEREFKRFSVVPAQTITLNVSHELPDETWRSISEIYQQMPGWRDYKDGVPYWFGYDGDPQFVWASVEPSGLLISGQLNPDRWNGWISELMTRLTGVLGSEVCDADA